jgi:PKD repeat protein
MRIPGRLLLISLVAIGLYFSPRLSTRAQQGNTVSVRPRSTTSQPGMPEVKAGVDRNRVPLGDEVAFTLSPAHVVVDSRYKVTLFFGDGARQVMRQPRIVHLYTKPGNYTYSILVESASQPTPTPTPSLAIPSVKLAVAPNSVEVNRPVTFAAQLSHRYPNIRFRFIFADGSETAWQTEANSTHAYRSAGIYQAYVDLGISANGSIKQAGGSKRESVQVIEASRPANVTVKLSASATSVEVAAPVTFIASVSSPPANARYRFDFGDQSKPTDWQATPQTRHRYNSAGSFSARAEVRVTNRLTGAQSASSNPVSIEVRNTSAGKPAVDLKVIPNSVPPGVPVFFRAIPSVANSQARYRFSFGDGSSPSLWSSESEQTHVYTSARVYAAFVEMAASGDEPLSAVAVSARQRVRVTPIGGSDNTNGNTNSNTPGNTNSNAATNTSANTNTNVNGNANTNGNTNTNGNSNTNANANVNSNTAGNTNGNSNGPNANSTNSSPSPSPSASETPPPIGPTQPTDWWKYVIIAAIILFGGYQAASYMFAPRPTFVPNFDPGKSTVGADKPLGFDLQMDVDPNIAGGEVRLDTQGDSFIKSERTE